MISNPKMFVMNKDLHITAFFDQPILVQNMVEKLAYRHYDIGYGQEKMPGGWKALETSTAEAYVSGTMAFDFSGINESIEEHINMPFITCFLFTCIKGKNDPYHLNWSTSLS